MANRGTRIFPRTAGIGASAAVSVTLHVVLIGAAVASTAPRLVERRDIPEVFAQFLAPPVRLGGQDAQREQLKFIALGDPDAEVRGAKLVPVEDVAPRPKKELSGHGVATAPAAPAVAGQDSVFTLIEVDSAATRYAWSAAPAYPPAMLEAKREGYVKAQWVVDESGYADTSSFELIDWTSLEFAQAVREALPFMRFRPARVGSKVVKQLVEQEFTFRINSVIAAPGTAAASAPKKPSS